MTGLLPQEISHGIFFWEAEAAGGLRLELNVRPEDGPTPTLKAVLAGMGLQPPEIACIRAVREAVILRPRGRRPPTQRIIL